MHMSNILTSISGHCPEYPDAERYSNFGYIRDTNTNNFFKAQDFCADVNGSLIKLETAEDRDALMLFLIDKGDNKVLLDPKNRFPRFTSFLNLWCACNIIQSLSTLGLLSGYSFHRCLSCFILNSAIQDKTR